VSLEPIVISPYGLLEKESIYDIPYSIKVYNREKIEKSGALNLLDFLKRESDINVSDWYGTGVKANVDLMGFGDNANSNILLLINGRRVNDIDLSGIDWTQVPLGIVDKIEIIKGAGIVLYGDNAGGGVINVITRKAKEKKFSSGYELKLGSYSLDKEVISGQLNRDTFSFYFNGEHYSTDGYRKNSQYRSKNIYSNFSYYPSDKITTFLELGYHDYRYGLPGALYDYEIGTSYSRRDTKYPNDYALMEDSFFNFEIKDKLNDVLKLSLNLNFRNKNGKDNWLSYGAWNFSNDRNIEQRGMKLQLFSKFDIFEIKHNLILGSELYSCDFSADKDDYSILDSDDWTDIDRDTLAFFIQDDIKFSKKFSLLLGTRIQKEDFSFDYNSRSGTKVDDDIDFTEEAYEIGINYLWNKQSNLFFHFTKGFRIPKTDEYFSTWATPPVNKNLLPQKSKTITGGFNAKLCDKVLLDFDAFYMKLDNELYYDPLTYSNKNYPETRRIGANLTFTVIPTDNLNVKLSYRYVDAKLEKGYYDGKNVPGIAQNVFNFSCRYSLNKKFIIYFGSSYRDKVYLINDLSNKVDKLDSY
jgi:iron complex outermembrane receptor protein